MSDHAAESNARVAGERLDYSLIRSAPVAKRIHLVRVYWYATIQPNVKVRTYSPFAHHELVSKDDPEVHESSRKTFVLVIVISLVVLVF